MTFWETRASGQDLQDLAARRSCAEPRRHQSSFENQPRGGVRYKSTQGGYACSIRSITEWERPATSNGSPAYYFGHPNYVDDITASYPDSSPELRSTVDSCSFKNMPARKSGRHDSVAIHLLQIMVLYRDILFGDTEFILIKQELQANSQIVEDIRNMAWSSDIESARLSEEDDRALSDGDRSSNGDAENQIVHDEAANRLLWGQTGALETIALHSRNSSSAPSVVEEDEDRSLDGGWSISSPTSDRRKDFSVSLHDVSSYVGRSRRPSGVNSQA